MRLTLIRRFWVRCILWLEHNLLEGFIKDVSTFFSIVNKVCNIVVCHLFFLKVYSFRFDLHWFYIHCLFLSFLHWWPIWLFYRWFERKDIYSIKDIISSRQYLRKFCLSLLWVWLIVELKKHDRALVFQPGFNPRRQKSGQWYLNLLEHQAFFTLDSYIQLKLKSMRPYPWFKACKMLMYELFKNSLVLKWLDVPVAECPAYFFWK